MKVSAYMALTYDNCSIQYSYLNRHIDHAITLHIHMS